MSDSSIITLTSFREIRFYGSILKDVVFSSLALFAFFVLRWPQYWLFAFHIAIWVVALCINYSDESAVIFPTIGFVTSGALALFDAVIGYSLSCFLDTCCVNGKTPYAWGIALCKTADSIAYTPLVWFAIAIITLASLSGAFRCSVIILLRRQTRADIAVACLYILVKIYLLTWPEISWPFLFWVQTIVTIALTGSAALFSYISKIVAYLLVAVVFMLDLILLLGTYGLLGSPTFTGNLSVVHPSFSVSRHLLYTFDTTPFITAQAHLNITLNTTLKTSVNHTVVFANQYNSGMTYNEVSLLYNITRSNFIALRDSLQNAQGLFNGNITTASSNTQLSTTNQIINGITNPLSNIKYVNSLVNSLGCCTKPSAVKSATSDTIQLYQQQYQNFLSAAQSFQKNFEVVNVADLKRQTLGFQSFQTNAVGVFTPVASTLTTWGKFTLWFLGAHHQNFKLTPLNALDFGTPVPVLVRTFAAATQGVELFLLLGLFLSIYARTAKSIVQLVPEEPKKAAAVELGVSTAVQIGSGELRKRHVV